MTTVLVTEFMDGSALAFLKNRAQVDYAPDLFERHDELLQRVETADALIVRNRTRVTSDLLVAVAKHLKAMAGLVLVLIISINKRPKSRTFNCSPRPAPMRSQSPNMS